MYLSFEGTTMAEIRAEVEAFLNDSTEAPKAEQPPVTAEDGKKYTIADVREAFNRVAKVVGRDKAREALKAISGADNISGAKEETYPALIEWCNKEGSEKADA